MEEYTKGEWRATKFHQVPYHWRIETEKNILAGVYSKANAHLIASAPDLYEALKLVHNHDLEMPPALQAQVMQALAKVEGGK